MIYGDYKTVMICSECLSFTFFIPYISAVSCRVPCRVVVLNWWFKNISALLHRLQRVSRKKGIKILSVFLCQFWALAIREKRKEASERCVEENTSKKHVGQSHLSRDLRRVILPASWKMSWVAGIPAVAWIYGLSFFCICVILHKYLQTD